VKKGKKFIALFLVFSLMMLSANLYAKERRGVKLIIAKTEGQQIRGELIAVKPNSLLLLDTEGKDVSVDIGDIRIIRRVKKSKSGTGFFFGLLIGGSSGVLLGSLYAKKEKSRRGLLSEFAGLAIPVLGLGLGVAGAFLGVEIARSAAREEKIQIEGMTDSEIQETLDKLRKKARIRDYK